MSTNALIPNNTLLESTYPLQEPITKIFAQYASSVQYNHIPASTIEHALTLLIDYIAACCAGYVLNDSFNSALKRILMKQAGVPESSILFTDAKLPAMSAAMMNAAYAHGADLDDGNKQAMGHVGAHVISALMALAEARSVTNRVFFESMIVGYDVYCRLSASVQPNMVSRGFHSTGMAGAIACAAACSKLIGLNEIGIYHAIAIASTQASGLLIVGETGQEVKPINPAKAAQVGILSAMLAEEGIVGSINPLESKKGWCHAVSEEVDVAKIKAGLGVAFSINDCYVKPYPSCRHTHCGIEAALRMTKLVELSEIASLELHIYQNAIDLAGFIDKPSDSGEAKFSIRYSLVVALSRGRFGLEDLDVTTLSKTEEDLLSRVKLVADNSFEDVSHGIRGAQLIVKFFNGRILEETVMVPKGDPERPCTIEDAETKLIACAKTAALRTRGIEPSSCDRLVRHVKQMPNELDKRFLFLAL